jgi:hypothetical protein
MPRTVAKQPRVHDLLSDQLRRAIVGRGLTSYAIAQMTAEEFGPEGAVSTSVIDRFVAGKRGLLLGTADRIAFVLGLRLVEIGRGKGRTRK